MKSHVVVGMMAGLCTGLLSDSFSKWFFMSIIFSVWPDADALLHLVLLRFKYDSWSHAWTRATGKWAHEHRNIFHIPLLLFPLTSFLVHVYGWNIAAAFSSLSFIHFVLDSFGIGWGVRWLYPFTRRQWKYHNGAFRSWTPKELKEVVEKEGNDYWLIPKT